MVWLCGCFVERRVKFTCSGGPAWFKNMTGGDLFMMKNNAVSEFEIAVAFGTGSTKREASDKANNYLGRVGRIHGMEGSTVVEFECTQETEFSQDF